MHRNLSKCLRADSNFLRFPSAFSLATISLISNSTTWRGLAPNCSRLCFRSRRRAAAYPFLVPSSRACAADDSQECPRSDWMASRYYSTASRSARPPLSTSSNAPPPCSRSQAPQPKALGLVVPVPLSTLGAWHIWRVGTVYPPLAFLGPKLPPPGHDPDLHLSFASGARW